MYTECQRWYGWPRKIAGRDFHENKHPGYRLNFWLYFTAGLTLFPKLVPLDIISRHENVCLTLNLQLSRSEYKTQPCYLVSSQVPLKRVTASWRPQQGVSLAQHWASFRRFYDDFHQSKNIVTSLLDKRWLELHNEQRLRLHLHKMSSNERVKYLHYLRAGRLQQGEHHHHTMN